MTAALCSMATKKGRPCQSKAITWCAEDGWPDDPIRCSTHLGVELREIRNRLLADRWISTFGGIPAEPACWSWPITDEVRDLIRHGHVESALSLFAQGRCAICGNAGEHLVEDHDHESGMTRGPLCRSCNTREGLNRFSGGVWHHYRQRHPALILGIELKYIGGWGWTADRPGDAALYPTPADRWRDNAMTGAFGA